MNVARSHQGVRTIHRRGQALHIVGDVVVRRGVGHDRRVGLRLALHAYPHDFIKDAVPAQVGESRVGVTVSANRVAALQQSFRIEVQIHKASARDHGAVVAHNRAIRPKPGGLAIEVEGALDAVVGHHFGHLVRPQAIVVPSGRKSPFLPVEERQDAQVRCLTCLLAREGDFQLLFVEVRFKLQARSVISRPLLVVIDMDIGSGIRRRIELFDDKQSLPIRRKGCEQGVDRRRGRDFFPPIEDGPIERIARRGIGLAANGVEFSILARPLNEESADTRIVHELQAGASRRSNIREAHGDSNR